MSKFLVTDTITQQLYPAADLYEVEQVIEYITDDGAHQLHRAWRRDAGRRHPSGADRTIRRREDHAVLTYNLVEAKNIIAGWRIRLGPQKTWERVGSVRRHGRDIVIESPSGAVLWEGNEESLIAHAP